MPGQMRPDRSACQRLAARKTTPMAIAPDPTGFLASSCNVPGGTGLGLRRPSGEKCAGRHGASRRAQPIASAGSAREATASLTCTERTRPHRDSGPTARTAIGRLASGRSSCEGRPHALQP